MEHSIAQSLKGKVPSMTLEAAIAGRFWKVFETEQDSEPNGLP